MKHFNLLNKVLNFSAERYFKTAGDLFIYEGDYETALSMVDKTLELDPVNLRALVLKGDILFCLNKDLEALKVLTRALQVDSECAEAYISKAGVLDVLGKYREALACCDAATKYITTINQHLLPTLIDQQLMLLIRLKKFRRAQAILNEAITKLSPEDHDYLVICYASILSQFCKKRDRVREQAQNLELKVINGALMGT